jgi:hypothetical protein
MSLQINLQTCNNNESRIFYFSTAPINHFESIKPSQHTLKPFALIFCQYNDRLLDIHQPFTVPKGAKTLAATDNGRLISSAR